MTFPDKPFDTTDDDRAGTDDDQTGLLGEYMTEAELSVELDVCRETIKRWRSLGVGPPITYLGRRLIYRRATARDWLKSLENSEVA